ncbi:MAG: phosphatidylserine/phosphatidylglycerophosphate/cardiolipin synthase family protein [Vicinamibacterales bacterium]
MPTLAVSRVAADQAFSRAAGAPLVPGNAVRLLKDAAENYPAWLAAIDAAERYIHFEMYILHDDEIGGRFAEALVARARAGVRVRLVYDWLGALGATSRQFWYQLVDAGVDVRGFNPPRLTRPLAWLVRDHRKMLAVDGRVAFVSGLCVGDAWMGRDGVDPWRDTGVEIRGPAVADVHGEFAEIWAATGDPLPDDEVPEHGAGDEAGTVALRVVGTRPAGAGMLRLDNLVAALARERLWITDAYFVAMPGYVQALTAAAADGVDVRLLVPGGSDLPLVRSLSRAGYRGLLEGGVRVFEWNGSMVHAKTAVADARWARVGSTNLNLQSWIGNWELDVAIEDLGFGAAMESMFDRDLGNATEVLLARRRRAPAHPAPPGAGADGVAPDEPPSAGGRRRWPPRRRRGGGSTSRAAAASLRFGNTMGAALTSTRHLGAAEAWVLAAGGLLLLAVAGVAALWPAVVAYPAAAVAAWLGAALAGAAWRARHPR